MIAQGTCLMLRAMTFRAYQETPADELTHGRAGMIPICIHRRDGIITARVNGKIVQTTVATQLILVSRCIQSIVVPLEPAWRGQKRVFPGFISLRSPVRIRALLLRISRKNTVLV